MKKIVFNIICLIVLSMCLTGCYYAKVSYDKEFRNYLTGKYNFNLDSKSEVGSCYGDCDYYGYYTINNDYNYAIQISKTNDSFTITCDDDAINKRANLYQYIKQIRGNDIAPNYLGFYKNTESGHISSSSIESSQLYYIVKYNDSMDLNTELKKDYEILKKAQEIIGYFKIKEMIVVYAKDKRLDADDWVLKINVKVSENSDIIFNPEKYLKKYEFKYRVSNYNSDESLSSLTYTEFEQLVKSKIERK